MKCLSMKLLSTTFYSNLAIRYLSFCFKIDREVEAFDKKIQIGILWIFLHIFREKKENLQFITVIVIFELATDKYPLNIEA